MPELTLDSEILIPSPFARRHGVKRDYATVNTILLEWGVDGLRQMANDLVDEAEEDATNPDLGMFEGADTIHRAHLAAEDLYLASFLGPVAEEN